MPIETHRDILTRLLKRREEIRTEALALDSLISVYQALSKTDEIESPVQGDQLELYRGANSRATRAAEIASMMNEARKAMIAEQRPLKRGELVRRLEAAGYRIVGSDKNKVFGTNIWRSGKFRRVEGRGYWPKDVVLPKQDG